MLTTSFCPISRWREQDITARRPSLFLSSPVDVQEEFAASKTLYSLRRPSRNLSPKPNQTSFSTMFNQSWIPPSLREFIDERVLKRNPLFRLAPGGPKNLRHSWPTQADRERLDTLAAEARRQAAEPTYKEEWEEKPLPFPPSHETSASTLPANAPPGIILSLDTRSETAFQEATRPSAASHHAGTQNRASRDTWITVEESIFSDKENGNDFRPDLDIPIRAADLTNSTDWPGHAILLCNPAFITRLTDLLKARKAHEKAKRDANLIKSATETFASKLKMEIARTEIGLKRFSPEIRLAKQYDVFGKATTGPSATALRLERKMKILTSFLKRAEERHADIFTALEKQEENLRAAQAVVNADLEKAFADADMLGGRFDAPKGVQVSDVLGEYKAFCRQNGIKWDGCGSEELPESLRVGPAVEEIN